jgi:hypothetical protein
MSILNFLIFAENPRAKSFLKNFTRQISKLENEMKRVLKLEEPAGCMYLMAQLSTFK